MNSVLYTNFQQFATLCSSDKEKSSFIYLVFRHVVYHPSCYTFLNRWSFITSSNHRNAKGTAENCIHYWSVLMNMLLFEFWLKSCPLLQWKRSKDCWGETSIKEESYYSNSEQAVGMKMNRKCEDPITHCTKHIWYKISLFCIESAKKINCLR